MKLLRISRKIIMVKTEWSKLRKGSKVYLFDGHRYFGPHYVADKKNKKLGNRYGQTFTHKIDNMYKNI